MADGFRPAFASFPLWGGVATVGVAEPGALACARREIGRVLVAVDLACSAYRPDSDLSRVNAAAGRPVRVGRAFLAVLQTALRVARATDGRVDPAVGRVTLPPPGAPAPDGADDAGPAAGHAGRAGRTWCGGRAEAHVPEPRTREPGRVPGGATWRSVSVDLARGTVSVPSGCALDLGAIGKAFAADRAARRAARVTGTGVLVALGGDLAAAGPAPEGGWRVRVADDHRRGPDGALPPGQDVALPGPCGLATSSLTVRRRELPDGGWAAHVVDPRSGLPVRGPWRTVSVCAATCVDANAASTAALVIGAGAVDWLAASGMPARLVHADGWTREVAGWPGEAARRPAADPADPTPPSAPLSVSPLSVSALRR